MPITETWLPWVVVKPGPDWKQGYSGKYDRRRLDQIIGEVDHSAGGSGSSAWRELTRKLRQASWTFFIWKDGTVDQHYPLQAITWHCGLRGGWSTPGNVSLVGKEFEGGGPGNVSEPLTFEQKVSSARITADVRALCPKFRSRPLAIKVTLFEHKWLSATACPSDRVYWDGHISAVKSLEAVVAPPEAPPVDLAPIYKVLAALRVEVDKLNKWRASKL